MVSDQGLSYALGNLFAGPSQWKRMYATGSTVAFALNVFLAYIGVLPALLSGSESALTSAIPVLLIEYINAIMPLTAVAMDRPVKAVFTCLVYIAAGLFLWTMKYETAMAGR
ncbi:hypothetical protein [Salarchaeum japonicum]|uniref:hypothetical protein n=1 Tax=Salarchaeum japonicum TaxID=555573 RepID=UPI003C7792D0